MTVWSEESWGHKNGQCLVAAEFSSLVARKLAKPESLGICFLLCAAINHEMLIGVAITLLTGTQRSAEA